MTTETPPAVLAPSVALERLEQKWRDSEAILPAKHFADELATLRAGLAQQGEPVGGK